MAISLKDMMFLICSRVLIFLVLLKKRNHQRRQRSVYNQYAFSKFDTELNIPTDEWIEHHWFENTGDIFTCIKADTHNIGD